MISGSISAAAHEGKRICLVIIHFFLGVRSSDKNDKLQCEHDVEQINIYSIVRLKELWP